MLNPAKKKKRSRKKEKEAYVFGVIVAERYVKEFPSFYMDIYKWITQEAMKRGSLTMLEVVDESREKLEQRSAVFSGIGVDGIIIVGEMAGAYIKALMAHTSVPVVCVDYYDTIPGLDYIVTDSYGGMEQVTELVEACFRGRNQYDEEYPRQVPGILQGAYEAGA